MEEEEEEYDDEDEEEEEETSPLHSRGSPTKGTKSKRAHKWAETLHHPCILGDPQRKQDKIRIGGAHKWAEMLHHPWFLGDPQRKGDKIRIGCLTLAFWETHKWAEMLHHPLLPYQPQQMNSSRSRQHSMATCGCSPTLSWLSFYLPSFVPDMS